MQILSRRTLKDKFASRARKRNIRATRDAIAKLKARPDPVIVNGFPENPILHQVVRDENGTFWKRNQENNNWVPFVDGDNIGDVTFNFDSPPGSSGVPIVSSLPGIPTDLEFASLVWFEGQLWGAARGGSRWYPAMRYTGTTG